MSLYATLTQSTYMSLSTVLTQLDSDPTHRSHKDHDVVVVNSFSTRIQLILIKNHVPGTVNIPKWHYSQITKHMSCNNCCVTAGWFGFDDICDTVTMHQDCITINWTFVYMGASCQHKLYTNY